MGVRIEGASAIATVAQQLSNQSIIDEDAADFNAYVGSGVDTYNSEFKYVSNSIQVFLNGQKLTKDVGYEQVAGRLQYKIIAPAVEDGDVIIVNYIRDFT